MASRRQARPETDSERDAIAPRMDLLRPVLVAAGLVLVAMAGWMDPNGLLAAAERTAPAFFMLAAVIAGGAIADRLGVFRLLAAVILSHRVPAPLTSASVLTFTAVISGVVNLDVAAVVVPRLAVSVAARR